MIDHDKKFRDDLLEDIEMLYERYEVPEQIRIYLNELQELSNEDLESIYSELKTQSDIDDLDD